jgi:hypothetical protein
MRRSLLLTLAVLCPFLAAPSGASAASVRVVGTGNAIRIDAAIDEYEDAQLVVNGAHGRLAAALDEAQTAPLLRDNLSVFRIDQTEVRGRAIYDPLPPLARSARVDGKARLLVRVNVPEGTPAGVYRGLLHLTLEKDALADVPISVTVWPVQLPARDDESAFKTLFLITPQS